MNYKIYKINDTNFLMNQDDDFYRYEEELDRIEYVRDLDIFQYEKLIDGVGDNLFERERYQSKVHNVNIFDYIKNCDKLKIETGQGEVLAKGNFFYIKSTMQSMLKNGKLSFPIVIKESDDGVYAINPGHFATQCMMRCGITKVSCLIYKNKNTNLDFGGIKIKSINDYINYVLKDISLLPYRISDNIVLRYDSDLKIFESYFFGDTLNEETIKIFFRKRLWPAAYNDKCFIDDFPHSYGKIAKNTFPLKVFIGNCEKEFDFEQCKKRILESVGRFVPPGPYYKDAIANNLDVVFNKWDGNTNDIPYHNKGFCIYTDSNVLWNESIFNLLFFTHSKKIIMKDANDRVIIFNCQHPFWKNNSKVDNIKQENIGIIPDYYTYI
jgi:hypothetical protein